MGLRRVGSVCLNIAEPPGRCESVQVKVYPHLVHCIKSFRLTQDMPTTMKMMRTKTIAIEEFSLHIGSISPECYNRYRVEVVFNNTRDTLHKCFEIVQTYPYNEDSHPKGVWVWKELQVKEYLENLRSVFK